MRGVLMLLRGLAGRCPACGRGKVFNSFYGLNSVCARCGNRFHIDGSPTVGAMIINMFITILIGFVAGILLVLWVPAEQLLWGLAGLLLVMALFSALFYRIARGLWVGITTLTGAYEGDERLAGEE